MAEVADAQKVEKKGGSNILLIITAIVLLLILIAGSIAGYMFLNSDNDILQDANNTPQEVTQTKQATSSNTHKGRSTNYSEVGVMYPMDKFIVNLLSDSGGRYLKISMNFELNTEELSAELDQKQPLIRDIVIRTLSGKTYEEISTIRGKENLKDEIVAKINQVLTNGQVNNIFFTDFVIQ